ncbi:hypothetical protein DUI70_5568 [Streptomyces albus]|nr:hypothetical protein DUI70_5568 [Streptomyces albus]
MGRAAGRERGDRPRQGAAPATGSSSRLGGGILARLARLRA